MFKAGIFLYLKNLFLSKYIIVIHPKHYGIFCSGSTLPRLHPCLPLPYEYACLPILLPLCPYPLTSDPSNLARHLA